MSDFPLCTRKTVRVRKFPEGFRDVEDAVCFGDLGVIRIMHSADWTIVHLPTGFTFKTASCVFRYQTGAVDAMMEMHRVKNRWSFDDVAGLQALQPLIEEVGKKHGGTSAARGPEVLEYREDLNGYDQENS